jgi:hypothetical protein
MEMTCEFSPDVVKEFDIETIVFAVNSFSKQEM